MMFLVTGSTLDQQTSQRCYDSVCDGIEDSVTFYARRRSPAVFRSISVLRSCAHMQSRSTCVRRAGRY